MPESQSTGSVTILQAYLHELKLHNAFVPCNNSLCAFVMQEYSNTTCSLKVNIILPVKETCILCSTVLSPTVMCLSFASPSVSIKRQDGYTTAHVIDLRQNALIAYHSR